MKYFQKVVSVCLAMLMVFVSATPSLAASNVNTNYISGMEVTQGTEHAKISYTEKRNDGVYYISETVNGNTINSEIYKVENGENKLSSTIVSEIRDGQVFCTEVKSNGAVSRYKVNAALSISDNQNSNKFEKLMNSSTMSRSKEYLRTEKYGISLVGKKVTVAIAAGAIVAATAYVSLPVAIKIISAAIAGGSAAGVTALPDYIYVTSKVYRTHSVGKIYTRYENDYYLDSARTQHIGSWKFSKRLGH